MVERTGRTFRRPYAAIDGAMARRERAFLLHRQESEALPLLEAAVAEADSSVEREPRLFARAQLGRTYMDLEREEAKRGD